MAEALLKHMTHNGNNNKYVEIGSAGLYAFGGDCININAKKVLEKEYGVIFETFKSSQLSTQLMETSDIILTMESNHKAIIIKNWPHAILKVHTLSEFAGAHEIGDIPDPFGGTYEDYVLCAQTIYTCLEKIL
jgi:protein arginine phosphatase